jgi:alanyl-tRNA synthetase
MNSYQLRSSFIDFFKARGHTFVPSSSLIPEDDPTLLFANAGMNQFKTIFLGQEKRTYTRAVSAQKCLRVSGKHNDLEEVGRDGRHHTFFEMLGNWSFGDYYKAEAIDYAWDFLTKVLGLPKDRLWASVFRDDDEAASLWLKVTGMSKERVWRFDEKDNFWEMGETGPCGPCSEIHYDLTRKPCSSPTCGPNCPCGRFVEIWNLVFIQYNRDADGRLNPLASKHVDTGMGFERNVALIQGVSSDYETDLFMPIIRQTDALSGLSYKGDHIPSFQVIADHIRALGFTIADGAIPSNEGRGYVLRRILRRAARHGRVLGLHEPFLYRLTGTLVDTMGQAYPELIARREHIALVVKSEEERFNETLDKGIELFEVVAKALQTKGRKVIPGSEVFKLYDTYGFPLDLTQVMAQEKGLSLDVEGYEKEMTLQRERARSAAKFSQKVSEDALAKAKAFALPGENSRYAGYERDRVETKISRVYVSESGKLLGLVLAETPFYIESGGQVDDQGVITGKDFSFEVKSLRKMDGEVIHLGEMVREAISRPAYNLESLLGQKVVAGVYSETRRATERNHTATHLLHAALRKVLGNHVHQQGSLVAPDRLRFDFTHFVPVTRDDLDQIEALLNERIRANIPVKTEVMALDEARKAGATALFGEKYEDKVRVVQVPGFSMELCGGTHVRATGEIGLFLIASESSIASGVRRIEAVTGEGAYRLVKEREGILSELSSKLAVGMENLPVRCEKLLQENVELHKRLERGKSQASADIVEELIQKAEVSGEVNIVITQVECDTNDRLREMGNLLMKRLVSGVGVLASVLDGKAAFVVAVTDDVAASGKVTAGELAKKLGQGVGGTGGGRPNLAQAGGKEISKISDALENIKNYLHSKL